MKLRTMVAMGLAVLSMALVPAVGMADDGPDYQPAPEGPSYQPEHPNHPPQGPKTAPKGNAYGYYCRGESKKHVKGEKGTAFSRCVRAHKRAANQPDKTAREVCRDLKVKHDRSGRHVPHGDKGTAFSRCVKSVAQQRREEAANEVTASVVA
jgi:hypothetical protein